MLTGPQRFEGRAASADRKELTEKSGAGIV